MDHPSPRRDDTVDVLHGVEVPDPYRWMEDLDAPELRAFVDDAAAHGDSLLRSLPGRAAVRATLERATSTPTAAAPWRRGDSWFQRRNDGTQDHDVLWTAPAGDDHHAPRDGWRVLVDPNGWEGALALGPVAVSPDGALLAYAVAEAGSDWHTWHVRRVATGEDLPDRVPWSKFAGASWLPDSAGFLTCCFDQPPAGEEHEAAVGGQRVVRHDVGGDTVTVHERPDDPQLGFSPTVSEDGRYVVLLVTRGTDPETRVHVARLGADGSFGEVRRLLDDGDAAWHPVAVREDELWCTTDEDAPLGRVVAVPLDGGPIREVVGEGLDRLREAHLVGDRREGAAGWLVLVRLVDAVARVDVHLLDGTSVHDVPLGGLVSVPDHTADAVTGGRSGTVLHVATTGFTERSVVVAHDLVTGTTTALPTGGTSDDEPAADRAPGPTTGDDVLGRPVVTERVFVASSGVRVPVFLVHREDVVPDGTVPTVLWGYGGFDIAVGPAFRPGWRAWVAHGGLLAVACLRGGGEYGRTWHDDGRLASKQHVFDDAIAVARWLSGDGAATRDRGGEHRLDGPPWTSPAHLGIEGRSNGGLLVGACITQAPSLFGSAVPEVGVLDLLRFHRFTIGWAWTSDYGDPDDPEAFGWLRAWSPLHAVRPGVAYPPTLVTTGDTDDRVVPSHSYKFAATLWHAQAGDAPIALRIDRSAGHGAGKPRGQLLDERADVLAWHAHHLGLSLTDGRGG